MVPDEVRSPVTVMNPLIVIMLPLISIDGATPPVQELPEVQIPV